MSKIYIILLTVFFYANVYSQQAYFVDGYHGGIYGHYPVKWKTQFIVDQLAMHPDWRICMEIEPETWDLKRWLPVIRSSLRTLPMRSLIAIISRERVSSDSFNMVLLK